MVAWINLQGWLLIRCGLTDGETGAVWILCEKRLDVLYKDPKKAKFTVLEKMKGKDLVGLEYEPLFDYYADVSKKNSFQYSVPAVTDE